MQSIMFIHPLKAGKLEDYKSFMAEISGARKADYKDMLKRYGLKSTKVHYHKIKQAEFVVVAHTIESDAMERIANWLPSTHPFDVWFKEQLQNMIDFETAKSAGQPQLLLDFNPLA